MEGWAPLWAPPSFQLSMSEVSLRICIYNKFPGDAAAGSGSDFEKHLDQWFSSSESHEKNRRRFLNDQCPEILM